MDIEPKFLPGMLIKLKPENFEKDMLDGYGLILDNDDGKYLILMYNLTKTSRKNLSVVDLKQRRIELPVKEADERSYFEEA
jgi:hypothetical protein